MKHNKKGLNSMLKNNLVQKSQNQKQNKFPVKNQKIKKKTMSLANLVDSSDDGEDEEMREQNQSDDEAFGNIEEYEDMKMDKMMTSLKQPSYQHYMGFLEEEQDDFED